MLPLANPQVYAPGKSLEILSQWVQHIIVFEVILSGQIKYVFSVGVAAHAYLYIMWRLCFAFCLC